MRRRSAVTALLASAILLAGCTSLATIDVATGEAPALAPLLPADALLFGEQHDAPEHARLERDLVLQLAARGALAALVLEMAEQGGSTAGLPPDADEAAVRAALRWQDAAWPWRRYGPVVMTAVQAGVPVLGANLPRERQPQAMADATLDATLPPPALARLQALVRDGHCGRLPEARIPAMTRIQVARDRSMADTLSRALQPGRSVLLVAGQNHVRRGLGVPAHLPPVLEMRVLMAQGGRSAEGSAMAAAWGADLAPPDRVWITPPAEARDDCAALNGP